jgi:hypothetical protein
MRAKAEDTGDKTTICISRNTHVELGKRGHKGDSYDDIVRRECRMDEPIVPEKKEIPVLGDPNGV